MFAELRLPIIVVEGRACLVGVGAPSAPVWSASARGVAASPTTQVGGQRHFVPTGGELCGMAGREPAGEMRMLVATTRLLGPRDVEPSGSPSSRCSAGTAGPEMSRGWSRGGPRGVGGCSCAEAEAAIVVVRVRSSSSVRSLRLPARRASSL